MPEPFFFALELSSQGAPAALLAQLTAHILGHVGCPADAGPELTDALVKAVSTGSAAGSRRCDVQFKASGRTLEILVTSNGGRVWQAARPIP